MSILERFENYAIRVNLDSHNVGFEIKRIYGETVEPPPAGLWLYQIEGAVCSSDDTTDFDAGEKFIEGFIKWDGCSNWSFHTEDCMAHFCGRKDATSIGRLLDRLFDITKERLATYDTHLAEDNWR